MSTDIMPAACNLLFIQFLTLVDCLCYIYCIEGSYFPSLLVDWILLVRMTNVNVCGVHIFYILANLSE